LNVSLYIFSGSLPIVGTVISALNYLGKDKVSSSTIEELKAKLSDDDFSKLVLNIEKMPSWMSNIFYLDTVLRGK
jgi:hypothetical protein